MEAEKEIHSRLAPSNTAFLAIDQIRIQKIRNSPFWSGMILQKLTD
jgi:hypothetical protein